MKKEYDSLEQAAMHMVALDDLMPLIQERLTAGQQVRFSPQGTSMLPMLRQGKDTVVLSPVPERLSKYDLPLYRLDDGKYVLHRIIRVGDTYTCRGDHLYKTENNIRHDQMIAVVTGFSRGGAMYSTKALVYRFYCRIWVGLFPLRYFLYRVKRRLRRWLG